MHSDPKCKTDDERHIYMSPGVVDLIRRCRRAAYVHRPLGLDLGMMAADPGSCKAGKAPGTTAQAQLLEHLGVKQ